MIEIEELRPLRSPVLIAAFEGWNDAADAASAAVDHLLEVWNGELVAVIDPEDFYDFQVNRPTVSSDEDSTGAFAGGSVSRRSPPCTRRTGSSRPCGHRTRQERRRSA